jgi:hypothetical protein
MELILTPLPDGSNLVISLPEVPEVPYDPRYEKRVLVADRLELKNGEQYAVEIVNRIEVILRPIFTKSIRASLFRKYLTTQVETIFRPTRIPI